MRQALAALLLLLAVCTSAFGQGITNPAPTTRFTETVVGSLPSASANSAKVRMVTDGIAGGDCLIGGGTVNVICRSNGTIWEPVSNDNDLNVNLVDYGAVADVVTNISTTSSSTLAYPSGVTTVTLGTGANFVTSTDVGKYFAINGGGSATLITHGTCSTTSAAGGNLQANNTYINLISAIFDNGTVMNGEGLTATGCSLGSVVAGQIENMTAPTMPTGSTGYRVYVYDNSTAPTQQNVGQVDSTFISNAGTGYSGTPGCAFGASPSGVTATCTAHQTGGVVDSINITNPGTGYGAGAPSCTISGTHTVQATCTAYTLCSTSSARNLVNNACDTTASMKMTNMSYIGPLPPTVSTWITTLATVPSTTTATLTDRIPVDVASGQKSSWGTDNTTAWTSALTHCKAVANNLNNGGCNMYFPPVGAPGVATGRYLFLKGIPAITQSGVNIVGGGFTGTQGNNGFGAFSTGLNYWTGPKASSEIVSFGRAWTVQHGNLQNKVQGGGLYHIGLEDMIMNGYGGWFIEGAYGASPTSDHLKAFDVSILNYNSGICHALANTQISEFYSIWGECRQGIRGLDYNSANQWFGGGFTGPVNGAPYADFVTGNVNWGAWFSNDPLGPSGAWPGNDRLIDTQFRDFSDGMVRFTDVPTSETYGVKGENIGLTGGASCAGGTACYGTALQVDSPSASTTHCSRVSFWGGYFTRVVSLYTIGTNCDSNDLVEVGSTTVSGVFGVDSGNNTDILLGNAGRGNVVSKFSSGFALGVDVMSGTTPVIDCSKGDVHTETLTAATVPTLVNCVDGQPIIIELTQDATGHHGWTWPAAFIGANVVTGAASTTFVQMFVFNLALTEALAVPTPVNATANTSSVTVNAAVATDQLLMTAAVVPHRMNVVGNTLSLFGAGTYTTGASGAGAMTFKVKACTVSGCGSGTVITLNTYGPATAIASSTNIPWSLRMWCTTVATGASGTLMCNGYMATVLSTTATAGGLIYQAQITGTSTVDLTVAENIQVTIADAGSSANNSFTQRQQVIHYASD